MALSQRRTGVLPEPISVTLQVADALEALGVSYFIGGSMASAVYGVSRATLDVDLIANLKHEDVEPLLQLLGGAFYADVGAIREAIDRHGTANLIHRETMFKVDLFIPAGRPTTNPNFAGGCSNVWRMIPSGPRMWQAPKTLSSPSSNGTKEEERYLNANGRMSCRSSGFRETIWTRNILAAGLTGCVSPSFLNRPRQKPKRCDNSLWSFPNISRNQTVTHS